MIKEIEYPTYTLGPVAYMSWGAIFAGAFVSAAVGGSLGLLAEGIGLASVTTIGGSIYMILAAAVSFGCGGWITGRMTRSGVVSESVIHALTAWAFTVSAFGVGHYWAPYAAGPSRQLSGTEGFVFLAVTAMASVIGGSSGTRLMRPHPLASARVREGTSASGYRS